MSIQARRHRPNQISLPLQNSEVMSGSESDPTPESDYLTSDEVDITYVFVWSKVTGERSRGDEPESYMRIRNASLRPEFDGILICCARLIWRSFEADFTCFWDPSTSTISEFMIVEGSMKCGMEQIGDVTISFRKERVDENEQVVEEEVKDENGNRLMFVLLDFGGSRHGPVHGEIIGKEALPGMDIKDVRLSKEETEKLDLEDENGDGANVGMTRKET